MGLISLPKKIDRKARFKAHMKEFFKDVMVDPDNTHFTATVGISFDLEYFDDDLRDSVQEGVDDWINTLAVLLDDDSYIFKYPNFYLPITANKPKVLILQDMKAGGIRHNGLYATVNNILAINSKGMMRKPTHTLVTAIHEYAHKQTRIDQVIPAATLLVESLFASFFDSGFDDWAVNNDNTKAWHNKLRSYAAVRDVGNVEHYNSYLEWLDEIAVRLKSEVAVSNEHHSLDEFWVKGFKTKTSVVDDLFTERYQNYLKSFAWPDQPKLNKVLNK